jgi:hypothetical protein
MACTERYSFAAKFPHSAFCGGLESAVAAAVNRPMSFTAGTHQAGRACFPISSVCSQASEVRPPSAHAPRLGRDLDFTLYPRHLPLDGGGELREVIVDDVADELRVDAKVLVHHNVSQPRNRRIASRRVEIHEDIDVASGGGVMRATDPKSRGLLAPSPLRTSSNCSRRAATASRASAPRMTPHPAITIAIRTRKPITAIDGRHR